MKKFLVFTLAILLLSYIMPVMARGFGGSHSFSSSSRSSGFTSSRSYASSYSRPSSSFSFFKSTPRVAATPSVTRSFTPVRSVAPVRTVTHTTVIHHTTIIHSPSYSSGNSMLNTIATYSLLNSLSHNGQNDRIRQSVRNDFSNLKTTLLQCHDNQGGRACIVRSFDRYTN